MEAKTDTNTTSQKKKKPLIDFKNLSKEDKNKYGAFGIFGIVLCGILYYGISNYTQDDSKNEVTEFSNPDAEQSKYNSKLEALNPKSPVQSSNNLENTLSDSNESDKANSNVDFEILDRQLAEIGNGNTSKKQNKQAVTSNSNIGGGSSTSNSHEVYGNYSMWQDKEPSNSRIGYAQKKPVEIRNNPTPSFPKVASYTEVSTYQNTPVQVPTEIKKVAAVTQQQIKAKLVSQGVATNNRSVSFVILDNFKLNGESITKGKSFAMGNLKIDENRIFCKIHTIKANGKSYNVEGNILGYDGDEGMPITGENSSNQTGQVLRDEAGNILNSVPIVGGIINRATKGNPKAASNKVALGGNIECTIVIYK